jgi:hypothetical protein
MDPNLQLPLSVLTNTLSRYGKRATTNTEKNSLYQIVEALGTAIGTQHPSPPGFSTDEFFKACAVSPDWAKVAA